MSCSIVSDSLGMDGSLPGSSVHGILQARILEWTAMPFSRGSSPPSSPALQANSLPPEPPGSLRITLVVSKYQTVVKGKDGIVKIHQLPHVWTFKAVDKCSHVRSREWVRESGVPRRLCAASTSAGSCVLPSQRGTENSGAVLPFKPTISRSKCKSCSDVAGTLFKAPHCKIKNVFSIFCARVF